MSRRAMLAGTAFAALPAAAVASLPDDNHDELLFLIDHLNEIDARTARIGAILRRRPPADLADVDLHGFTRSQVQKWQSDALTIYDFAFDVPSLMDESDSLVDHACEIEGKIVNLPCLSLRDVKLKIEFASRWFDNPDHADDLTSIIKSMAGLSTN
jgi:hypothetical protein